MAFSVRSAACQAHSVAPGSLGNGSDGMGSPRLLCLVLVELLSLPGKPPVMSLSTGPLEHSLVTLSQGYICKVLQRLMYLPSSGTWTCEAHNSLHCAGGRVTALSTCSLPPRCLMCSALNRVEPANKKCFR